MRVTFLAQSCSKFVLTYALRLCFGVLGDGEGATSVLFGEVLNKGLKIEFVLLRFCLSIPNRMPRNNFDSPGHIMSVVPFDDWCHRFNNS